MSIAQLSVDLIANLAKFDQGMRAAVASSETASKKIVASLDTIAGGAKSAIIAITGIGSLKAFEAMISNSIEAKSKLYDLSLQTGITVEALSALGKVGKFSNTSLEDIGSASNKLNKALATSSEDSRGAATAIKAIGLDFQTLKAQSPDQQLLSIAKALDQYADDGGKAAAAQLLFGKTGAQLLPFLKELAEKQELVGTQTTESAKLAKEYEDNLVRLNGAGQKWKNQLATELLPTLVDMSAAFVDLQKGGSNFLPIGDTIRVTLQGVTVVAAGAAAAIVLIAKGIGALSAAQQAALRGEWGQAKAIAAEFGADFDRISAQYSQFRDKVLNLDQPAPGARASADYSNEGRNHPKRRLDIAVPDKDEVNKARDAYAALVKQIQEKIGVDQAELDGVEKLTEGQKLQAKIFADVDGGQVQLTLNQKLAIDTMLQQLLATEQLNLAKQKELKWLKDSNEANATYLEGQIQLRDTLQQQAKDAQQQLAEYGLTADAIKALEAARLRDAAAALDRRAVLAEDIDLTGQLSALYRDQAAALRATAGARQGLADAQRAEREDPAKGLTAAAQEYLELARNAGTATKNFAAGALNTLENDLTSGLAKGKINLQGFVDYALQELYRLLVVRPALAELSKQLEDLSRSASSSKGGLFGALADAFGVGQGYNGNTGGINGGSTVLPNSLRGGAAGGTNLLDRDMITLLHKGEAVVPKQYNPAAGGGAPQFKVNISNTAGDIVQASARQSASDPQALEVQVRRLVRDENSRDLRSGAGPISNGLKGRGVALDGALPKRG